MLDKFLFELLKEIKEHKSVEDLDDEKCKGCDELQEKKLIKITTLKNSEHNKPKYADVYISEITRKGEKIRKYKTYFRYALKQMTLWIIGLFTSATIVAALIMSCSG